MACKAERDKKVLKSFCGKPDTSERGHVDAIQWSIATQPPPLPYLPFAPSLTEAVDQYSFASANYTFHWDIATWCAGTVLSNQKSSFCCCFSNFVRNSFLLIKAQFPRSKANMTFSDLSFSFYSWSAKNPLTYLERKAEVGLFTNSSFGISQTTFVSQISGDPLTHTLMEFFISVKFLSFTHGSFVFCYFVKISGDTWIGKCNKSHCFIQNYQTSLERQLDFQNRWTLISI